MGWGDILHNAIKDTKGLVDPRSYYRTGKFAVEHPVGFGKAVGKSYLDLAEHPIRTLENHPVDTLLQFAPLAGGVGKLADVGAEVGAARYASMTDKANLQGLSRVVRDVPKGGLPGTRAGRLAKAIGGNERQLFKDLKYDPSKKFETSSVPGGKLDREVATKLHSDLGKPAMSMYTDYATPSDVSQGLSGSFVHRTQDAGTMLHPQHLAQGYNEGIDALLTQTMLHEARHGFQKANVSRTSRYIDSHRPYGAQKMEKDANEFAASNLTKYKGLVHVDPFDKRIPQQARATMDHYQAVAKPTSNPALAGVESYEGLSKVVDDLHGRVMGVPSEDEILNHVDQLVADGKLSRQDAIDLQMKLADNPYEPAAYKGMHHAIGSALDGVEESHGPAPDRRFVTPVHRTVGESYEPPSSAQDLFTRAIKRARGGGSHTAGEHHFAASQKFIPTSGAVPTNVSLVDTLRRSI